MNKNQLILLPIVSIALFLGVGCNKAIDVSQKSQNNTTTTKITIYESYDCDKVKAKVIEVAKTKAVAQAVLEELKMTSDKSMASY